MILGELIWNELSQEVGISLLLDREITHYCSRRDSNPRCGLDSVTLLVPFSLIIRS